MVYCSHYPLRLIIEFDVVYEMCPWANTEDLQVQLTLIYTGLSHWGKI